MQCRYLTDLFLSCGNFTAVILPKNTTDTDIVILIVLFFVNKKKDLCASNALLCSHQMHIELIAQSVISNVGYSLHMHH